jgi:hypothetical protein
MKFHVACVASCTPCCRPAKKLYNLEPVVLTGFGGVQYMVVASWYDTAMHPSP